jgi:uncharacterized protein with von Willebrand factor type A (vWA) domain
VPDPGSVLLRGVDLAAFATGLSRRLRREGIDVGLTATESFTRALIAVPPDRSAGRLYWCARLTLIRRDSDLTVFDRVFAEVFDLAVATVDRRPSTRGQDRGLPASAGTLRQPGELSGLDEGLPWVTARTSSGAVTTTADEEAVHAVLERLPSRLAALADEPFDRLVETDLALLTVWMATARSRWPRRRTRRDRVRSNGRRVALRATMERARATGWEPVNLALSRPVQRPRRLVMVCDMSQSMQPYTHAYLHVMRAAAVGAESEVFAFSTTLTRLTSALRHNSTDVAIEQATDKVTDRFGGTRIATNITALLRSRHGTLLRGAIVVVASDGWDSDPPEALAKAMERLGRRAHRVIWLNPRSASPGFEPTVGSMAAALPFCDEFRSAHTLASLRELIDSLATAR